VGIIIIIIIINIIESILVGGLAGGCWVRPDPPEDISRGGLGRGGRPSILHPGVTAGHASQWSHTFFVYVFAFILFASAEWSARHKKQTQC